MRGLGFVGGEAVLDGVFVEAEEVGYGSRGGEEGGGGFAGEEGGDIEDAVP